MVADEICSVMSFAELREFLTDWKFFGEETLPQNRLHENDILALARKHGIDYKFRHMRDWHKFEKMEIDFSSHQFVDNCFKGLQYENEELIIITHESWVMDKVFLLDSPNYHEFADKYDKYSGVFIDFVQPMDFIFFLLNQRVVVFLHHEGKFTHLHFSGIA